jgi:hypothetical protein
MWFIDALFSLCHVAWAKFITSIKPRTTTSSTAIDFAAHPTIAEDDIRQIIISMWLTPSALSDIGSNIELSAADLLAISKCSTSYKAASMLCAKMFTATPPKKKIQELGIRNNILKSSTGSKIAAYLLPCVIDGLFTSEDINTPVFRVAIITTHSCTATTTTDKPSWSWATLKVVLLLAGCYMTYGGLYGASKTWRAADSSYTRVTMDFTQGFVDFPLTIATYVRDAIAPDVLRYPGGRICAGIVDREVTAENDSGSKSTTQVVCFKPGSTPKCPATGICSVQSTPCTIAHLQHYLNFTGQDALSDEEIETHDSTTIWRKTTMKYGMFTWGATSCDIIDLMTSSSDDSRPSSAWDRIESHIKDFAISLTIAVVVGLSGYYMFDPCGSRGTRRAQTKAATSTTAAAARKRFPQRSPVDPIGKISKDQIRGLLQDSKSIHEAATTRSGASLRCAQPWLDALYTAVGTTTLSRIANVIYNNLTATGKETNAVDHVFRLLPGFDTDMLNGSSIKDGDYTKLGLLTDGPTMYLDAFKIAMGIIHLTIVAVTGQETSLAEVIHHGLVKAHWYEAVRAGVGLQKLHSTMTTIADTARTACIGSIGASSDVSVTDIFGTVSESITFQEVNSDGALKQSIQHSIRELILKRKTLYEDALRSCCGKE